MKEEGCRCPRPVKENKRTCYSHVWEERLIPAPQQMGAEGRIGVEHLSLPACGIWESMSCGCGMEEEEEPRGSNGRAVPGDGLCDCSSREGGQVGLKQCPPRERLRPGLPMKKPGACRLLREVDH